VFSSTVASPLPGTGLALADVDGDGDLDLLTANAGSGSVSVRLNRPTSPLATSRAAAGAALVVVPNPATGRVQLTLPPTAPSAELLDALGRLVRTVPATAGVATLDVAGLAPGLYLVRAAGQVARLVVE
jgi:sarcosine oxidase gamma subunit